MKTEIIIIRVDKETKEKLQNAAKEENVTLTKYILERMK